MSTHSLTNSSGELPREDVYRYWRWPEDEQGDVVQFRLVYKGPLPTGDSRHGPKLKHPIRQQIHRQLRELWKQDSLLNDWLKYEYVRGLPVRENPGKTYSDALADNYALGPYRFLPLITKENGLACALEILFLRRDNPGSLVTNGGDIDNRLKVLFDALRRPTENNEIKEHTPELDENPFFCLLEDDRLMTEVRVMTDKLLVPMESTDHIHDVLLIMHVTAKVINPNKCDLHFFAEG